MPPTSKSQPVYFSGRVHSVNFSDEAKAFYVLRMALDAECVQGGSGVVTIRGDIPGVKVSVGAWFGWEGVWDDHPKYGRQVKVTRAPVLKDGWDNDTCVKVLVSQGIGPAVAAKLREAFTDDLAIALADPERIKTVPGMTPFIAEHIAHKWKLARSQFLTLDFLGDLGLPQGKIRQVWEVFGDTAQDVLSTDPWSLLKIDGVTFQDCDVVARRLGLDCSPSNLNRVKGAAYHATKTSKGMGHLYLSSGELLGAVRPLDPLMSDRDIAAGLKALVEDARLVVDRATLPGLTAIYDPWSFKTESGSADVLRDRLVTAAIPPDRAARYAKALLGEETPGLTLREAGAQYLSKVGTSLGISLSSAQMEAVLNALTESVSVITGLPGSGKTTSLRMALTLLHEAGMVPLVVAPTGIAAKRVASVTGVTASTIHRAFKAKGIESDDGREVTYAGVVGDRSEASVSDGADEQWGYGPNNPHPAEVVVIDESSMVDQAVLYRILTCTRADTRLVFVGDAAQLPSVGAGNVLRDIIASGRFPTVSLTEIFRQSDTSPIVTAAHDIFHGRVPEAPLQSDFRLFPLADEDEVLKLVLNLSEKLYGQRANFQVLSPRHAGTLGVTNLNTRLRAILNPAQHGLHEMTVGGEVLREGDRVIVSKNDYKLGVFNGDVAKINRIDKNAKMVEIKIHGPPVVMVSVPFAKVGSLLRLAYAVTVHRCVRPDTLVETRHGLVPICQIDSEGVIGTPVGPRAYHGLVSNPSLPALKLSAKEGPPIFVTPDHGVDVWDGTAYVRREAREISVGDIIRLSMGVTCDADALPSLPVPSPGDPREAAFSTPSVMSEELAELLGLLVADGTFYRRGFRLSKRHPDVVQRFSDLVRRLFGYPATVRQGVNLHVCDVNSSFLSRWLLSLGGLSPKAKAVPGVVLQSPESVHRKFLRGLFEDGTVNLKRGAQGPKVDHVEWSTVFPEMATVVSVMLLRAGIPSAVKHWSKGRTAIYIYGRNAARFGELIGFVSAFKQERFRHPTARHTRDWVPVSPSEAREFRKTYRHHLPLSLLNNVVLRGRISRETLAACATLPGSTVLYDLQGRSKNHHTAITGVEPCVCPTMCVTVPDGHQFVQNGWVGWNCQGLEYDVVVMPLVGSFAHQLQRNLFYTAITRAKKKVLLVGTYSAMERAVNNNREDARNTLFSHRLRA